LTHYHHLPPFSQSFGLTPSFSESFEDTLCEGMKTLHYDVLERILQLANDEHDELTLRAWSRVAHIWTPLAQRALFRTVTLSGPQHARRLIFHLRHAPHLQQLVRVLETGIDFTTRPRIRSTLVPLVPNIERIAFLDVFPDWELLSCFPGLTSVRAHVGTYNYRDTSTGSKSPALTAIALREYEFLYTINPVEPTPEFPQEAFCTWLSTTATHAQGSLRSASFMVTKPQDLPTIAQLLSTHAQLQHLTLQLLTPIVAASSKSLCACVQLLILIRALHLSRNVPPDQPSY
jgi:hypothetical protein